MNRHATLILTTLLTFAAAACGEEAPRDAAPPPRGVQSTTPSEIRGSVNASLPDGTCDPVTGDVMGRAGLHGAMFSVEPRRQILVLYGADGTLRLYRDQMPGPAGYTVHLDVDADSAWVLDRATRTRATGTVADFEARPDLGPPIAIADSVRRRCGVPARR